MTQVSDTLWKCEVCHKNQQVAFTGGRIQVDTQTNTFPKAESNKETKCSCYDKCPIHLGIVVDVGSTSQVETWENEFDNYVNELRRDRGPDEEGKQATYYFGYKGIIGNELFNVVDFGNIKTFIKSLLHQQRKEIKERIGKRKRYRFVGQGRKDFVILDEILNDIGKEE